MGQTGPPRSKEQTAGLLRDQVAIVSGATGGIGEATAWRFAREGAKVAVHSSGLTKVSRDNAQRIAESINKSGREAMAVKANVSDYSEVKSLVDSVAESWGKVTSVVLYAGLNSLFDFWQENPLELKEDDLLSAVKVDFLGSYNFIRAVRSHMRKKRYGKIVLTSSSSAIVGDGAGYRYTLGKDLNRITVKSLAAKLIREDGIYLNAIAPGTIDTPSNRTNYGKKEWDALIREIPLGRPGLPDDIANVAIFLCSHLSDYVVGQTIIADGGEVRL